jgi:hypothetical protein
MYMAQRNTIALALPWNLVTWLGTAIDIKLEVPSNFFPSKFNSPRGPRSPQVDVLSDYIQLDTPEMIGLLWTKDRPVERTAT